MLWVPSRSRVKTMMESPDAESESETD